MPITHPKPRIVYMHGDGALSWSWGWVARLQQGLHMAGSPTFFEYQPYGIVQVGSGSAASFTQEFSDTARQPAHALDATERTIEETHELSDTERSQIREVVREIRAEVSQSSPNVPRLRG
jgi:hypothetical protein